jgi:FMN-dependent NADH-azoreductase
MKLLHIDSSISGESSASRRLSAAIVAPFVRAVLDLEIVRRDLDADPIPHLDSRRLPTCGRQMPRKVQPASRTIREPERSNGFLAADDVVVIGAPMYNLTIPSQLKAWIDRILIAGKTFR